MEAQARKCQITFPSSLFSASVTGEFPVLLVLPSEAYTSSDPDHANADGGDIRVMEATQTTEKAREVESFVLDGAYEIWAPLTNPSSVADNYLWVYYKDSGASEPAANSTYGSQNAWDANYGLVMHLGETPASDNAGYYKDSTANANHGTGVSMAITPPAGKIGLGAEFDGTADYIQIADSDSLDATIALTMSAWFKGSAGGVVRRLFNKCSSSGNHFMYELEIAASNKLVLVLGDNSGFEYSLLTAGTAITQTNFNHLAAVYDASDSTGYLYTNGAADGNGAVVGSRTYSGNLTATTGTAQMSRYRFGSTWYYGSGVNDEVRMSTTIRSAAWLAAEYAVVNSLGSVTPGTPEDVGAGGLSIPVAMNHYRRLRAA